MAVAADRAERRWFDVDARQRAASRLAERGIVGSLFAAASVATLATLAIFAVLVGSSLEFFGDVSLVEFLTGTTWAPDFSPRHFGAVPLIKGTLLIAAGALALGVPVAVGTAVYLSEFASDRVRSVLKPAIELLAGVPSIVFGVVALFVISPVMSDLFGTQVFSATNAMIVLAIMIVPIVTTLSEDALRAVPRSLREGSLALGAAKWETTREVVIPAAASGITAAILLGFGRAVGETMAVTLAAGLVPTLSLSPLDPSETITAFIANRAGGDLPTGSVEYLSLFALGTLLFLITLAINILAVWVLARQRRRFAST